MGKTFTFKLRDCNDPIEMARRARELSGVIRADVSISITYDDNQTTPNKIDTEMHDRPRMTLEELRRSVIDGHRNKP